MDLLLTGAVTGKTIHIPSENYGMGMSMNSIELSLDDQERYPKKFTRISFKEVLADGHKYLDCLESVEEVLTQLRLKS